MALQFAGGTDYNACTQVSYTYEVGCAMQLQHLAVLVLHVLAVLLEGPIMNLTLHKLAPFADVPPSKIIIYTTSLRLLVMAS